MIRWYRYSVFHHRFSLCSQRTAGFYTIEMMLSLVLGAIVIAVLLALTLAGWRTYLTSMSYATTTDSSRAAFVFLERQFSLAGYRAFMWETPDAVFPPIPAGTNYPAFRIGQVVAAQPTGPGANSQNVILHVRKQGGFQDDYDATGALITPLPWASSLTTDIVITDCMGERIPNKVVVIERYSINASRQLVCRRVFVDATSPAYYQVPLASIPDVIILNHVLAMRAAFGTYLKSAGEPDGQVQRYLTLQQMGTGSANDQKEKWLNIVNIQLDLLIARGTGNDDKHLDNSLGRGNTMSLVGDNNINVAGSSFATVESRIINLKNRAY